MRRRRTAALCGAALSAVTLAACGSGGSSTPATTTRTTKATTTPAPVAPGATTYRDGLTDALDTYDRALTPFVTTRAIPPQIREHVTAFSRTIAKLRALEPPPGLRDDHAAAVAAFTRQYRDYQALDRAVSRLHAADRRLDSGALIRTMSSFSARLSGHSVSDRTDIMRLIKAAGVPFSLD